MKPSVHFIITLGVVFSLLSLTGCKTTEANYRSAYEKAKSKGESSAVDKEVYENITREDQPTVMTFDNVSFPAKGIYMVGVDIPGLTPSVFEKFNVVAAKFKQLFNAKSMAKRLRENGFVNAFVAKDRDDTYYVVAATCRDATEASEKLISLKGTGIGYQQFVAY